jgi:hypothetical protein
VCDQENSTNEEAKARYRAVENTTTMGCDVRKTDKQTNNEGVSRYILLVYIIRMNNFLECNGFVVNTNI